MKKIIYILIIMLLITGCKKEDKNNKKESNRETRTMLTCTLNDEITYMFYYDKEDEPYYKADYLEKKKFASDEEAEAYQEEFYRIWVEQYADKLLTLEYRVNENTSFINISAFHDTDEDIYNIFFGDRYNLNMNDMNKLFNDECLIKPIKK